MTVVDLGLRHVRLMDVGLGHLPVRSLAVFDGLAGRMARNSKVAVLAS